MGVNGLTFRSQVRTESLYGTNLAFPFPADWSASAEITQPRVVKDLNRTTTFDELVTNRGSMRSSTGNPAWVYGSIQPWTSHVALTRLYYVFYRKHRYSRIAYILFYKVFSCLNLLHLYHICIM